MSNRITTILPWQGGKYWMARWVWRFLGDPRAYIEPFGGSIAVLLGRPPTQRRGLLRETVNDRDGLVVNVWRSIQHQPDIVADILASLSYSTVDMVAAQRSIDSAQVDDLVEKMQTDPGWCDPAVAAYTLFCNGVRVGSRISRKTKLSPGGVYRQILNGNNPHELLREVSQRLRRVRILCHDWQAALTTAELTYYPPTAVFLDPPYARTRGYDCDSFTSADFDQLTEWCLQWGQRIRIVLTVGADDPTDMLSDDGWRQVPPPLRRGQQNYGTGISQSRDRILLSPAISLPQMETLL